jgi:tetratricopeptide (TPR) repeat protein
VARNDPQAMASGIARSLGEWLAAECARGPLMLVIDDLHWSDLPSAAQVGEAMRVLRAKPLMVLALGRPETHEAFPELWAATEKQEVTLGPLPPRAAERLVRALLGEGVLPGTVERIIARAEGNPFYLEELIRRVAEGSDTLPETVLALLQSRLERLEPEARLLVRAASIFGAAFWRGAVAAVVGSAAEARELDGWLRVLCDREVFTVSPDTRFVGEPQFTFRHDLLREAAYGMVTPADRVIGHRLAGEWLEHTGETDALSLADHFELGGQPARAVPWLVKAALGASIGGNFEAVVALRHRSISCGSSGAQLGLLGVRQGQVLAIRGDFAGVLHLALEAVDLLPKGSTEWLEAVGLLLVAATNLADAAVIAAYLPIILDMSIPPQPTGPHGFVVWQACYVLITGGHLPPAERLLARAEAVDRGPDPDPIFLVRVLLARAYLHLRSGRVGQCIATATEASRVARDSGDAFGKACADYFLLEALVATGQRERCESAAREILDSPPVFGGKYFDDRTVRALAESLLHHGRVDEAVAVLRPLCQREDRLLSGTARGTLAHALIAKGEFDSATREAGRALADGATYPNVEAWALSALAAIELLQGRPTEGLRLAERGLDPVVRGCVPYPGSVIYLTRAEALRDLGMTEEADAALREARDRIVRIAATLEGDPGLRRAYLEDVEVNARTMALASARFGEEP